MHALARRRSHYVNSALGRVFYVGQAHERAAAAKELLESDLEILVNLFKRFLELLTREDVNFFDRGLRVFDGIQQVFSLRLEKRLSFGGLSIFFERHHVDGAHGIEPRAHFLTRLFFRYKFIGNDAGQGQICHQLTALNA